MTNMMSDQLKYLAPSEKWKELIKNGDTANEEQKKAQEFLKDFLLSSMQMQNLIVLTGCGTSRSVGGTINEGFVGCCNWKASKPSCNQYCL